jgi:hypothetical protein
MDGRHRIRRLTLAETQRCDNSNLLMISPIQRLCMSGCNLPTSCSFLRVNRTASLQLGISQVAFSTSIAPPTQKTSEQPNFAYARGFLSRLPAHCSQNDSSPSRLSPRSLAGGACSSPAPCVPIHLSFGCLRLGHLWPRKPICTCIARSVGQSTASGPPSDDCISSRLDLN